MNDLTANATAGSAATAAPTAVAETPSVCFTGDRRAYWRLLIRGAVLLGITLGIYRFWFSTDIRRFLWAHTEVAGDTLEYSGTAYELLIGFLFAIALLIPLNVGIFVIALGTDTMGPAASILAFPLLAFLGQFAVYRARRYRLTRTIFRGIRCHQDGSAWLFAARALLWWVLIAITFGLAYPLAQASLERFKMRHTHYGDLRGRFEGSGLRLLLRGLPMWLLAIGPMLLMIVYAVIAVQWSEVGDAIGSSESGEQTFARIAKAFPDFNLFVGMAIAAVSMSATMAAVLFPVFQAMMLRWWLSGLRLGALTLHSHLRGRLIYGAYLRFVWYCLLFSIAMAVVSFIVYNAMNSIQSLIGKSEAAEFVSVIAAVGLYVTAMLGYSTIYQGTVKVALWRHGAESIDLAGLAALGHVTAKGTEASSLGEGLADALNVGGI